MSIELYFAFVFAASALILAPGPNVALMTAGVGLALARRP